MCPTDTTPDPRDMLRAPDAPEFAQPGSKQDQPMPPAAKQRPPLPAQPKIMPADVEDEDADPVVDTGPGIDDGQLNRS
jgi:hypothetical protein